MLKLPKNESGKPWTLRVVAKAPKLGGEELWGKCDFWKREIVVWKGASNHGVAREVLLHELLHRYMYWMDEEAVRHLANELDDVLDLCEKRNILEL